MEDFGYCKSGSEWSDRFVPEFLGKSGGDENELLNYLLIINSKIFIILLILILCYNCDAVLRKLGDRYVKFCFTFTGKT